MKVVFIFGPQAVGKMTIGQELAKITELKLFHNHMTIDLVSNFFDYSTKEGKRLVALFREEIFKEVAKSDLDGLIFTYVWAFDQEEDKKYIESVVKIFEDYNADIYFVELETDLDTRLRRNTTENRLKHKPSKRNIKWTEKDILESNKNYRLNSFPGEITYKNYLRIDNTNKDPEKVAKIIKDQILNK